MNVCYNIKNASRAKQSDLIKALSIYSKTVDKFAQTDTNQIMDYISKRYDENRIMFFSYCILMEKCADLQNTHI